MKHPSSAALQKIKHTLAIAVFAAAFFFVPRLTAVTAETPPQSTPAIPYEYGKVIYQKNGDRDQHLYIICQSHRNAATGENSRNTAKVQAEIYRIGEWLIRNEQIELLLPEGFFRRKGGMKQTAGLVEYSRDANVRQPSYSPDDQALERLLTDTAVFTNADKLLKQYYNVKLQQVEDEQLYFSILDFLYQPERQQKGLAGSDLEELDYLQERRSAAMLQNIPDIIDNEWRDGNICRKKAIFTIGMAHANEIIQFLKEGKIEITVPRTGAKDDLGELNLVKGHYGVTVILPRGLAEDQEALALLAMGSS